MIVSLSIYSGSCSKVTVELYPYQPNRPTVTPTSNKTTTEYPLTVEWHPRIPKGDRPLPLIIRVPASVFHRDNTARTLKHLTRVFPLRILDDRLHRFINRVHRYSHLIDTQLWSLKWTWVNSQHHPITINNLLQLILTRIPVGDTP